MRYLDMADNMLDNNPDSAMVILQTINPSSIHSSEAKARYALLYFASAMKTGDIFNSDSILTPAIRYYQEKEPSREKMLSFIFNSC